MRKTTTILITLCTLVALTGCLPSGNSDKSPAVAKVDGVSITQSDFDARLQAFPADLRQALNQPENRAKVLDQLIDEQIVVQAAKKSDVRKKSAYTNQLKQLKKELLVNLYLAQEVDNKISVSENDIQAYYQGNKEVFNKGAQRRARHILVASKEEAAAVIKALNVGADFATLAAKRSQDPGTKDKGGDLGWFGRGQLVPEFESAVFSMKKGSISKPIQTQFGYHVIQLDELSPAVSYDEARQQIQQALVNQQKQQLTQKLLETLRKDIKVERLDASS